MKAGICVHGDPHSPLVPFPGRSSMAVLPTREMLGLSNPGRVLGQAAGQGGSSQNSASVTGCAAATRGIVVITGPLQKWV